jgi:hypothetical protein
MKVSVRYDEAPDGFGRLLVYRPRERTYSLPGSAYATQSGFWIINIPGKSADVVCTEKTARNRLLAYYDEKKTPYE